VTAMMGLSVEPALLHVQGTKLNSTGPLLITHWGMSGPAVLKLSSFGARDLADLNYNFKIQVNWTGVQNHDEVHEDLISLAETFGGKMIGNLRPFALPERLWIYLLDRADIEGDKPFRELGRKTRNKLVNALTNDIYEVKGKTTFKEEFVTCGGVSWNSVNPKTMESRVVPGLYFSGEVLDVDGVTGGFNFQAAWTTGFVAGKLS
jgi:predicted Rossmann fold flavoprotein